MGTGKTELLHVKLITTTSLRDLKIFFTTNPKFIWFILKAFSEYVLRAFNHKIPVRVPVADCEARASPFVSLRQQADSDVSIGFLLALC